MKRIAIVVATPWEAKPIQRRLHLAQRWRGFSKGENKGQVIYLGICGVGPKAAAAFAEKELSRLKPNQLIISGFAGALRPELKTGDIVFDDNKTGEICPLVENVMIFRGSVSHSNQVLANPGQKQAQAALSSALAVDMESQPLSQWAVRNHVPFVVVRAIFDSLNDSLVSDWPRSPALGDSLRLLGLTGAIPVFCLRWRASPARPAKA